MANNQNHQNYYGKDATFGYLVNEDFLPQDCDHFQTTFHHGHTTFGRSETVDFANQTFAPQDSFNGSHEMSTEKAQNGNKSVSFVVPVVNGNYTEVVDSGSGKGRSIPVTTNDVIPEALVAMICDSNMPIEAKYGALMSIDALLLHKSARPNHLINPKFCQSLDKLVLHFLKSPDERLKTAINVMGKMTDALTTDEEKIILQTYLHESKKELASHVSLLNRCEQVLTKLCS